MQATACFFIMIQAAFVDDMDAIATMAENLLSNGVSVFKAVLIRETGQYRVSWETENERLHNVERDKQPDDRDNGDRSSRDHPS